jgi:hypothetical protein
MEEQNAPVVRSKIYRVLTIVFASLFAIFWSLGAFFFWFLLGLAAYFFFLNLYSSGIKFNLFEKNPSGDPYNAYRNGPRGASTPATNPATKAIRIVVFSAFGVFMLLMLIGLFFGDNNSDADISSSEISALEQSSGDGAKDTDYTSVGNDFLNKGNYDSAIWYYNAVLAKSPDDQYGLYNKSLAYFMKQSYSASIALAQKCLYAHPDYNEAWWLLGDNYYSINNVDSAVYCLERAYSNNFSEPNFLQLLAETYLKAGDRSKAKEFYLKVVEKDSSNMDSYKALIALDPENASSYQGKVSALERAR